MRKFLGVILLTIVFFIIIQSTCFSLVFAGNNTRIIMNTDKLEYSVGENISIKIQATNSLYLSGVQFTVKYDPQVLKLKGEGAVISSVFESFKPVIDTINGELTYYLVNPQSTNTVIALQDISTITFTALKAGNSQLLLNQIKAVSFDDVTKPINENTEHQVAFNIKQLPTEPAEPTIPAISTHSTQISSSSNAQEQNIQINADAFKNITDRDIKITVPEQSGRTKITLELPAQEINKLKESVVSTFQISSDLVDICILYSDLLKHLQNDSKNIKIIIESSNSSLEVWRSIRIYVDEKKIDTEKGKHTFAVAFNDKNIDSKNPSKIIAYIVNGKNELNPIKSSKYDVKTQKMSFTTGVLGKYIIQSSAISFNDLQDLDWAKEYIEALAARNIANGIGNNQFNPNAEITREEFAKFLVDIFDLMDETATTNFTDVELGSWYYKFVASANKAGIVNGIGANKFGIGDIISREDMATMAFRAANVANCKFNKVNVLVDFTDNREISDYALEAVRAMQQANIINGTGGNEFNPKNNATRAQSAKIIYLILSNINYR